MGCVEYFSDTKLWMIMIMWCVEYFSATKLWMIMIMGCGEYFSATKFVNDNDYGMYRILFCNDKTFVNNIIHLEL